VRNKGDKDKEGSGDSEEGKKETGCTEAEGT
jgi:hypothetical protein